MTTDSRDAVTRSSPGNAVSIIAGDRGLPPGESNLLRRGMRVDVVRNHGRRIT